MYQRKTGRSNWLLQILAFVALCLCVRGTAAQTLQLEQTLNGHRGEVYSVAFSPDGRILASGGSDKTVRFWDVKTGKLKRTLNGHRGEVYSVAFSPDGRILASGGSDKTVRFWDVKTGKLKRTLNGHRGEVYSVAFSPDGRVLASGGSDQVGSLGEINIWATQHGGLKRRLPQSLGVFSVKFMPDGRKLLIGSGFNDGESYKGQMALIDTWTGIVKRSWKDNDNGGVVYSVALSPKTGTIAYGNEDGVIRLRSSKTGRLTRTLAKLHSYVLSVTLSPNGNLLASGDGDKSIALWDAKNGKRLFASQVNGVVRSVSFSPDGKRLVAASGDGKVRIWRIK